MMKSNKVLVALIGCMLTFSGVSFASEAGFTPQESADNSWASWFAAKRAALGSWSAQQSKKSEAERLKSVVTGAYETVKPWATEKYRYWSGETERELKEKAQVSRSINSFLTSKEFSTSASKVSVLKNIRDFFTTLERFGVEKVEEQTIIQACNNKLVELTQQQEKMILQEKENRMQLEKEEKEEQRLIRKAVISEDVNRVSRDRMIFALEKDGLINMEKRNELLEFSADKNGEAVEDIISIVKQNYEDNKRIDKDCKHKKCLDSKRLMDTLHRIKLLMY